MTKKLHLLRHAHSPDRLPGQDDKDRHLSARGVEEAKRIGKFIKSESIPLQAIYASHAIRAHATALIVKDSANTGSEPVVTEALYDASIRSYFNFISAIKNRFDGVMIVGHNPVITHVAEYLTKVHVGDMATCGLVTIQFDVDEWLEVSEGNGHLLSYVYPEILQPI